MAKFHLYVEGTNPPAPASGFLTFFHTGATLKSIDSAGTVITYAAGVTQEQVEDYVGNLLTDSSTVNVTYNDAGNVMTFDVIAGAVDHDALLNFVANEHINHASVSITAGTGLSGGGDITASRTLSIANTGVTAATYGNNAVVPQITVNAQGQLTSVASSTIAIGAANITDFAEQVDDRVNTLTVAGTGISKTYNDAANTLTITNTDLGSSAVTTHEAAGDPHPQYLTAAEGNAAYQPLDSDLTAISGLAGTGLVVRTGTGTATTRFIAVSTGLFGSAVDGVSGNPTIGIGNTGVTAATYGSSSQSAQIAINAQGQATSAANVAIDHDALSNFVANEHIDHSAVTLNAGTYISSTGLGNLTASRTINHGNSAVTPATYGGVNAIPVLGIGATGHVDSASTVNPTAALLTGLGAGTNTAILSTDTLLAALANIQAQINAVSSASSWTEVVTTADIIVSSNVTFTNVTELAFTATAGRSYYCEYTIIFRTQATNTGIGLSVGTSDTAAGTISLQVNVPISNDGTAALYTGSITSFADVVTSTGVQTAQPTWFIANMKGVFICTTSGTVVPQFRSEVNGSNVNFGTGSVALIREFV